MARNHAEHLQNEIRDRLEGDLLTAILSDRSYPWEPSDPAAAAYFTAQDAAFDLSDWSEAEVASRAAALFAQLDRCWSASPPLASGLQEQFANAPTEWLTVIAERARALATDSHSRIERLIACVEPLLSGWAVEDLQVFARPYAYAMRSGDRPSGLADKSWETLSPVEQARCALEIAQCALAEYEQAAESSE
ncbi:MAG: hypothetical protein HC838_03375 [Spirulinaceae cyanobacterium RM2_2_10]|nr:hypothetical protein [Spirulinaceae cyanobacterium SM2_1_0]NJO19294.1 hypothetical protein [Spirulinaceae cyanobacterium RM2_2_10]